MKVVVDRLVQYPNRFQLVNVDTSAVLGVFDFNAVTGSVVQVGTEINAELFDSIQADLTTLAESIVNESTERRANVVDLINSIATKITANGGEIGETIATFGTTTATSNIASGEKVSTIFSKIQNWFSRLKPLAFKSRIEDDDVSVTANIDQSKIFGLTAMQTKLNGIEAGANKYTLPTATANALGGVKVGSRLSVATDGTISADVQSDTNFTQAEKTKLAGISTGANKYTLPTASASVLGGVKIGNGINVNNGIISVESPFYRYYLPYQGTGKAPVFTVDSSVIAFTIPKTWDAVDYNIEYFTVPLRFYVYNSSGTRVGVATTRDFDTRRFAVGDSGDSEIITSIASSAGMESQQVTYRVAFSVISDDDTQTVVGFKVYNPYGTLIDLSTSTTVRNLTIVGTKAWYKE